MPWICAADEAGMVDGAAELCLDCDATLPFLVLDEISVEFSEAGSGRGRFRGLMVKLALSS